MQKQLFLSLAFILCGFLALGQSKGDMVFLNDGSFVRGTIMEFKAGESVKIQTLEGEIREVPIAEVKKTRVEGKYSRPRTREAYKSPSGYFNTSSISLLLGGDQYNGPANAGFQTINGYQYKGRWQAGLGVGVDFFRGRTYVPLTGEFRFHLRDQDVSPFVGLSGGYSLTQKEDGNRSWGGYQTEHKGGLTSGIELGLRNMTRANIGYTLSAGYRFQELRSTGYDGWWNGSDQIYYPVEELQKLHRLVIKFGVTFN